MGTENMNRHGHPFDGMFCVLSIALLELRVQTIFDEGDEKRLGTAH